MKKLRSFLLLFSVALLIGVFIAPGVRASLVESGSDADPLVTKSWVDKYLSNSLAKVDNTIIVLEQKIDSLELKAKGLKTGVRPLIFLTVGKKKFIVGTQEKEFDVSPCIIYGRTMVPLRFIGEAFGVEFTWDGQLKKVTYNAELGSVELVAGKKSVKIGKNQIDLDVPVTVKNGRTLVPLRFIGNSFGASVTWDGNNKTVEIK
jgi:hypothetical protein